MSKSANAPTFNENSTVGNRKIEEVDVDLAVTPKCQNVEMRFEMT